MRPLKASQTPFCRGLPRAMWRHSAPVCRHYRKTAIDANSAPLSETIVAGVARHLFAGSCSVYGKGEKLDLDESDPLNPLTACAQS